MKIIILIDWSDDQSQMPHKTDCLQESPYRMETTRRSRRVMKTFEFWRRKQSRPYQLVLWHTHYPWRFLPPKKLLTRPFPFDCRTNLFEKMVEAVAKNYNPNEPVFVADDAFVFPDNFDMEPYIQQAMQPNAGIVLAGNAWVLNPAMQRVIGGLDADPHCERFEKDWTLKDFCAWVERTNWTFAKTYAETAPHEYCYAGKHNVNIADVYKATMYILRNGYVRMYYQTPFMSIELNNRLYWSYICYNLVNRSLEGDLREYR